MNTPRLNTFTPATHRAQHDKQLLFICLVASMRSWISRVLYKHCRPPLALYRALAANWGPARCLLHVMVGSLMQS